MRQLIGVISFAIIAFGTTKVWANGHAILYIEAGMQFQKYEMNKNNGVIQGELSSLNGIMPIAMYKTDPEHMIVAYGNLELDVKIKQKKRKTLYRGQLIPFQRTRRDYTGTAIRAKNRPYIHMSGFVVDPDQNDVIWEMKADNSEYASFSLKWGRWEFFFEKEEDNPGSCQGELTVDDLHYSYAWCESSGSMEDFLFTNPEHVIAWFLNQFVFPEAPDDYPLVGLVPFYL